MTTRKPNKSSNWITTAWHNIRQAQRRMTPTAIVCEPLRLCYYSIPKVASSTVKRYLVEHGYKDHDMATDNMGLYQVHAYSFPRATASEILRLDDHLKFAVVRDPYRRIWSCYVDKILRNRDNGKPIHPGFSRYNRIFGINAFDVNMDFTSFLKSVARLPDWMADGHFRSQHRFIAKLNGKLLVDRIVKIEALEEEMRQLTRDRELPAWNPPNLNPSKANSTSHDWSAEQIRIVNSRYADDFKWLSYPLKSTRL